MAKNIKTKLFTTQISTDLHLSESDHTTGIELTNLHYCGDKECNVRRGGKWVAKYPKIEKENPEWLASHYNLRRDYRVKIWVDVWSDGTISISK
jgi:hypothetical protein